MPLVLLIPVAIYLSVLVFFCVKEGLSPGYYDNLPFGAKTAFRLGLPALLSMMVVLNFPAAHPWLGWLLIAALVIVSISDVLIIKTFILGMAGFFVVHLINSVNWCLLTPVFEWIDALIFVGMLALTAGFYAALVLPRITDKLIKIIAPVYLVVIIFSTSRSISTWHNSPWDFTLLLGMGTVLFLLCDIQVMFEEFVRPMKNGQIINHLLYYVGLLALTLAVALPLM